MSQVKIYPVILSGGSGVRLWPLSRSHYPKQFLPLPGGSLFDGTVKRALGLETPSVRVGGMIVVCNESQRFIVGAALSEIPELSGLEVEVILEPVARNTAPAIALAALSALDSNAGEPDADPLLLVLPSDHEISPQEEFSRAVDKAVRCSKEGGLVLFGIKPWEPATGFGYIEQGEPVCCSSGSSLEGCGFKVSRFVEKPSLEAAGKMLDAGGYFWNSGMFLFGARAYLNELKQHEPEVFLQSIAAWRNACKRPGLICPAKDDFEKSPKISIDYAVMERTDRAVLVPADIDWSDLGSFEAFYQSGKGRADLGADAEGNVAFGDVLAIDSENNYLAAHSRLLAVLGVNDMVVVETADSVLVLPRERSQEVTRIVEKLKASGRLETEDPARVPKPWGSYEVLCEAPGFKIKRIEVASGASLSLQMHYNRSEHWVVVEGQAQVTLDEDVFLLNKDESIYIPVKTRHRLANPARDPLVIIEVQNGTYLGEDDIVRFEDDYGRES